MKRTFRLTEAAAFDLYVAVKYISEDNPDAAQRFLEAFEKTCDLLSEMPDMGSVPTVKHLELQDMRMMRIKRFPKYLIFYQRFRREGIEIIRVIHAARDYPTLFGG